MRIGIVGYGNLGRAQERLCLLDKKIELVGIFTQRVPNRVGSICGRVYPFVKIESWQERIDTLLICRGSSSGLLDTELRLLNCFNIIDVYDCHEKISYHLSALDLKAKEKGRVAISAVGWDPGLLSMLRLYFYAFTKDAQIATFFGEGISQGHTEALKRIEGVADAVQITVPNSRAVDLALRGVSVAKRLRHTRRCYIVPKEGYDKQKIIEAVRGIEGYFMGESVEISFLDDVEHLRQSSSHKGRIIGEGAYGERLDALIDMQSNPDFTAQIQLSSAFAAFRLYNDKKYGAYTLADIPPRMLLRNEGDLPGLI